MFELIIKAALDVLGDLLQIGISTLISLMLYRLLNGRIKGLRESISIDLLLITGSSLVGVLLPLDTFGVMPLLVIFLKLGLRQYAVLPVLFSNIVFNMLIPFNDPSFVWRTGINRLIIALLIGVFAGALMRKLRFSEKALPLLQPQYSFKYVLQAIHQNIELVGIYLLTGAIANVMFKEFILNRLISFISGNPSTAGIPLYLSRFNVVHPLFLLALSVLYSLFNLKNLSAVLVVLKPKTFVLYLGYFAVWIFLLAGSIFF